MAIHTQISCNRKVKWLLYFPKGLTNIQESENQHVDKAN